MKKITMIGMFAIAVIGLAITANTGQIELRQDKNGVVIGHNKNDFGQYNLKADETAKLFPYNNEPFDSLEVDGEGKLVFIVNPTPTPMPDLLVLIEQMQARIDTLETQLADAFDRIAELEKP